MNYNQSVVGTVLDRRFGLMDLNIPGQDTTTFIGNMRLPVHRWMRFSAGFSAEWVRQVVTAFKARRDNPRFLDPFAGVGTSVLAAEEVGVPGIGIEAQPFIARIAKAKLLWDTPIDEFQEFAMTVLSTARVLDEPLSYPSLILRCYPEVQLAQLHNLRLAWASIADGSGASELSWLTLVSILRSCSSAGTAPWQYILPGKGKASVPLPFDAYEAKVALMTSDMSLRGTSGIQRKAMIIQADSRVCDSIETDSIDLVVTSPPYANNYDYADATRLEMSFMGDVNGWRDLHSAARVNLVRACSQHVSIEKIDLQQTLEELAGVPFQSEIADVCRQLANERLNHGGKKDYHLMVAAYFSDMRRVWATLRPFCKAGAHVCFVVGDSAPYGIHVPVERWLGELALSEGFVAYRFDKTRDRNVKWKNRKHRVPLHEGRLWVEG